MTRGPRELAVVAVLAGACLSTPGPATTDGGPDGTIDAPPDGADAPSTCADQDGDGWFTCGTYPDCRDDDPAIHPGAIEDLTSADHDCSPAEPTTLAPTLGYTLGGGDHEIVTSSARYRLEDAHGGQLASLVLGGTEWLYPGPILEQFSGVHMWTVLLPNDARSVAAAAPRVTVQVAGRGLVRADVQWTAGAIAGSSTYTFTIDGRAVRTDDFVTTPTADDYSGVTSFVALDATRVDELRWTEVTGTPHTTTIPFGAPGATSEFAVALDEGADGFLCASSTSNEVVWTAAASATLAGGGQPRRGLRGTRNRTTPGAATEQVALAFDWEFNSGGALTGGRRVASAAIWAGGSTTERCAAGIARLRAFRTPPTAAMRAGHVVEAVVDRDVGADGFIEDGGYWGLQPTGGLVRIRFEAPGLEGGWHAFHLAGWDHDVVLVRETAALARTRLIHGQDYLADVDDGGLWLSLRDGLGTDTLEFVDPSASCPSC